VTFERATARGFDFVIGADGLHSNVRSLVFGPESQFAKRLGTFATIFTVPNFLDLDYWQMFHMGDNTMAGVYSARNNTAPDFYFDEMAQIIMDRWSQGRVALVGDAGYCCAPLSGQGTSVAMLGAYVLAGELAQAGGDYQRG